MSLVFPFEARHSNKRDYDYTGICIEKYNKYIKIYIKNYICKNVFRHLNANTVLCSFDIEKAPSID